MVSAAELLWMPLKLMADFRSLEIDGGKAETGNGPLDSLGISVNDEHTKEKEWKGNQAIATNRSQMPMVGAAEPLWMSLKSIADF